MITGFVHEGRDKELFLGSLIHQGYSMNTRRAYDVDLNEFTVWHCIHHQGHSNALIPSRVSHTPHEWETCVAEYLNEIRTTMSPKTVQRRLGTLRAFWSYILEMRPHLDLPPLLPKYKLPTPAKPTPHPLPNGMADVLSMLDAAPNRAHAAIIALCGLCGLRIGEAVQIERRDVDLDAGILTVRAAVAKGSKERRVPISARAREPIQDACHTASLYHEERLMTMHERNARRAVTQIGKRAGITRPVSSHDLRATFATAVTRQHGIRVAQELLGHSDTNTTAGYAGVTTGELAEAVEVI